MKIVYPLAIAVTILMAGCVQTAVLYVPPPTHISPNNAGAADASLLMGTDQYVVRGAWSPVEQLELFALTSYHNSMSDSSEHAYHFYQEAGVGWYFGAGDPTTFSLLAGFGWGHAKGYGNVLPNGGTAPLYEASGNYIRPFVGIRLDYHGSADTTVLIRGQGFGFGVRLAHVDFARIYGQPGIEKGNGLYIEPTFITRWGARETQIETQTGFSSVYSSTGIESSDVSVSIGVHLQLDRLF